jgi:hypothetical protein
MLAYRDSSRSLSADSLRVELLRVLGRVDCDNSGDSTLEALLRAGELECALADAGHPSTARIARVTDAMAARLLSGPGPDLRGETSLESLALPDRLQAKTPEGFAYYALDPFAYAQLVEQLGALDASVPMAVIGVRSIGTSLGAIVSESLHARGIMAARSSVRPTGHPWARTMQWTRPERIFVERARDAGAQFIVVDEGPGLSGSTFLAVAEAIEALGVSRGRIALFCSHQPHTPRLKARDAQQRWARFRCYAPEACASPQAEHDLSAGAWRRHVYGPDQRAWPASWTQLERVKRLSEDGHCVDKFEGLPPYCEAALARAWTLEQAGFGPALLRTRRGFARFEWVDGQAARSGDLDASVIAELARYCAFRLRTFGVSSADPEPIADMLRTNVQETFGVDVGDRIPLAIVAPVIPDARMQPHEWCFSQRGRLMKFDGHGHGDGHLLPGPTDVCWDLAGAVVEWDMDRHQQDALVTRFEQLTGARVRSRLTSYLVAYAALRIGEMSLALLSAQCEEIERIAHERARYGRRLEGLLQGCKLLS